jgi:Family of unknown function (DUF5367)
LTVNVTAITVIINVLVITLTLLSEEKIVNIQDRTSISKQHQSRDIVLFASIGAGFWLIFLLPIRFWGEYLFIDRNPWLLGLFIISIPLAWVLIKIVTTITKVEGNRALTATAIVTITAMLLDGIALTWFQGWYGLEPTRLVLVAAWLLWGAGMGLAMGYWESIKR